MPQIKCNITECNYNKNVLCSAPMIEIKRNNIDHSTKSDQTKCETFKKK